MATASQIVDALLIGFEHQDHPSVQAALDHLIILVELHYKPEEGAAPRDHIRYDAIREALNTFRISPLSAINRLMQELHDIDENENDMDIAIQILIETVERVTTIQPVIPPMDWDDDRPVPSSPDDIGEVRSEPPPAAAPQPAPSFSPSVPPVPLPAAAPPPAPSVPSPAAPPPAAAPPKPAAGSPPPSAPRQQPPPEEESTLDWLDDFSGDVDSEVLAEPSPSREAAPGMSDDKTITGEVEWLKKEARRQKFITETGTFNVVVSDDDTAELPAVQADDEPSEPEAEQSATEAREAHFSAYFPPEIRSGVNYGLYVYGHTEDALEVIRQNVAQFKNQLGGEVPEATTAEAYTTLKYGTTLTVVPESDHAKFDPPQQSRTWNNDWTRFEFDFMSEVYDRSTLEIRISVQVAGIEIAHIDCQLAISETGEGPRLSINPLADARLRSMTARMYQRIFISYSRRDTLIADRYRLAQMAAGQDVFMDSYSIRAGEDWQAALASAIDEADIFQLFWSENSAQSENVRHEWEYALGYRCPQDQCVRFIRPVFWQKPLPAPPNELSHLNFKFVPFQGIEEVASNQSVSTGGASPKEVMQRLDALDERMTAIEDSLEIIKQALRAIYHRLKQQ